MKVYLVGGAVRDELLGIPVHEFDWVVVGATPAELLGQGYQQVGKDFPVFLHPETKDEYALARMERKVSPGYTGFEFDYDASVSLKDDLIRRDLTINAMAKDDDGNIVDPYGGRQDLSEQMLRHVSQAFVEDPVRILRVARFASRLPQFNVAPETNQLMQRMVKSGEVDALVAERVWQELSKTLKAEQPARFFQVLRDCMALDVIFPDLNIDDDEFAFACEKTTASVTRFALLLQHCQGIKTLCKRLKVPTHEQNMALLMKKVSEQFDDLNRHDAEALLDFLQTTDAFRRVERFELLLDALIIMQQYHDKKIGPQAEALRMALKKCNALAIKPLIEGVAPKEIPQVIYQARVQCIKAADV